jgi:hypothetical protein
VVSCCVFVCANTYSLTTCACAGHRRVLCSVSAPHFSVASRQMASSPGNGKRWPRAAPRRDRWCRREKRSVSHSDGTTDRSSGLDPWDTWLLRSESSSQSDYPASHGRPSSFLDYETVSAHSSMRLSEHAERKDAGTNPIPQSVAVGTDIQGTGGSAQVVLQPYYVPYPVVVPVWAPQATWPGGAQQSYEERGREKMHKKRYFGTGRGLQRSDDQLDWWQAARMSAPRPPILPRPRPSSPPSRYACGCLWSDSRDPLDPIEEPPSDEARGQASSGDVASIEEAPPRPSSPLALKPPRRGYAGLRAGFLVK